MIANEVPHWIRTDPSRIRQVLINLLGNAVKFSETGTITLRISLTEPGANGSTDALRLRFEVEDEGPGISQDAATFIFEPYRQDTANLDHRKEGAGLGLAISKQICEAMGGQIGVETSPSGGALFWFEIEAEKAAPVANVISEDNFNLPPLKVLLAEDSETNRIIIEAYLDQLGVEVHSVSNGAEALVAVERESFEIALLDVNMPVMNGLEAARRIRAMPSRKSKMPIIALTAYSLPDMKERCRDAGMDGFLSKPMDRRDLFQSIAHHVLGTDFNGAGQDVRDRRLKSLHQVSIDMSMLDDLRKILDPQAFTELLDRGLTSTKETAAALAAHAQVWDMEEIENEAHKLIGRAGSLGMRRTSIAAARLERLCRDGDLAEILKSAANLQDYAQAESDAIQERLGAESRR